MTGMVKSAISSATNMDTVVGKSKAVAAPGDVTATPVSDAAIAPAKAAIAAPAGDVARSAIGTAISEDPASAGASKVGRKKGVNTILGSLGGSYEQLGGV